jgi:CDP-diacylglycerol pyrophosphatase
MAVRILKTWHCVIHPLAGMILLILSFSPTGAQQQPPPLRPDTYSDQRNGLLDTVKDCLARPTTCTVGPPQPKPKYVVVRDSKHKNRFLLIAAVPGISGIEANDDKNPLPNYWEVAWALADRLLNHKQATIGLAINSANNRDQDQLHIHLACLDQNVYTELHGAQGEKIKDYWQYALVTLPGDKSPYDAISVQDLSHNPFAELLRNNTAVGKPPPRRMADQTVVVTPALAAGTTGFYILARSVGSGEEQLLTDCP